MRDQDNYWTRRLDGHFTRRDFVRGTAVAGAGAAGLGLVGCGGGDDGGEPTSPAGGGEAATPTRQPTAAADLVDTDAELKVGFGSFPSTLDATTAAGQGGQAASNVYHYDALFTYTPGRVITNGGLADFEFRENNTIFRIKARPGIEFHNGEPLDAEAMKFYFDRILGRAAYNLNFQSANKARASWMGDIKVVDKLTIDIAMKTPFVDAPEQSGGINFALTPRQYILDKGDEFFAKNPVSVGPMKFQSWIPDQEIRSVRYEKFPFDRSHQFAQKRPWIKTLVGRFIPEEQARLAALEAGEIDIAYRVGPDLAKAFQKKEGFKVVVLPDVRVMQIELPISWSKDPKTGGPNPWRDKRVRQAANYAIDTDAIVKNLLTGNEERAYAPFPARYPLPLGSLKEPYKFDPKRARALLEEAGQVGFEFQILLATGLWTGDRVWMPAIQQMLNDVGFKVSVDYQPLSEALALMRNKQTKGPFVFNQGSTSKGAPLGPLFAYALISTAGAPYSHAQKDDDFLPEHRELQLLVEKANGEFDEKKRNDLFQQAATIHYENAFGVYLFNLSHLYVTRKNIVYSEYYDTPTGMNLMDVQKLRA